MIVDIIQKLMKSETLGRVTTPQPTQQMQQIQQQQSVSPVQPQHGMNVNVNPPQIQHQMQPQMMQQTIPAQSMMPPPSIPKVAKAPLNAADYRLIAGALKELQLDNGYLKIFENQRVRDEDLLLLRDMDLLAIFPDSVGARIRFRDWIKRNQRKINGDIAR